MIPDKLIATAKSKAKSTGKPYVVALIDGGESRDYRVIPEYDTRFEEFHAFDGEVMAVIYPDGNVEY